MVCKPCAVCRSGPADSGVLGEPHHITSVARGSVTPPYETSSWLVAATVWTLVHTGTGNPILAVKVKWTCIKTEHWENNGRWIYEIKWRLEFSYRPLSSRSPGMSDVLPNVTPYIPQTGKVSCSLEPLGSRGSPQGVINRHRPKCVWTPLDRPTTNQSNGVISWWEKSSRHLSHQQNCNCSCWFLF